MLNELRNHKRENKITDCWSSHGKIIYKTLQGRVVDATEKAREAQHARLYLTSDFLDFALNRKSKIE